MNMLSKLGKGMSALLEEYLANALTKGGLQIAQLLPGGWWHEFAQDVLIAHKSVPG